MKDLLGDTVHHIRFPLPIKLHSALYKRCNWVGCHDYNEAKRGERRKKSGRQEENIAMEQLCVLCVGCVISAICDSRALVGRPEEGGKRGGENSQSCDERAITPHFCFQIRRQCQYRLSVMDLSDL
jgi:hypothetical protein